MPTIEAKIIHFNDVPEYVNDGGRNQLCRDLLQERDIGHIGVGYNVMKANACNGMNTHDRWHQIFVITKGRGSVVLNGVEQPIEAPCVVVIPAGVEHDVLSGENQTIEYVYINDFLDHS